MTRNVLMVVIALIIGNQIVPASAMTSESLPDGLTFDAINPYIQTFPLGCDELLPEDEPFTEFLRNAARVWNAQDKSKKMAKELLRLTNARDELQRELRHFEETTNRADTLHRAYLCNYFKEGKRLTITTASPELKDFVAEFGKTIREQTKEEFLKLRRARDEARDLHKEIEEMSHDFSALRSQVRSEIREEWDRALYPSSNRKKKSR